jgi:hypothetical protein
MGVFDVWLEAWPHSPAGGIMSRRKVEQRLELLVDQRLAETSLMDVWFLREQPLERAYRTTPAGLWRAAEVWEREAMPWGRRRWSKRR